MTVRRIFSGGPAEKSAAAFLRFGDVPFRFLRNAAPLQKRTDEPRASILCVIIVFRQGFVKRGKADSTKVLHGVGTAVSIVSSRLGFLFLIIFPTLIVIVYEAMAIVEEVKKAKGA